MSTGDNGMPPQAIVQKKECSVKSILSLSITPSFQLYAFGFRLFVTVLLRVTFIQLLLLCRKVYKLTTYKRMRYDAGLHVEDIAFGHEQRCVLSCFKRTHAIIYANCFRRIGGDHLQCFFFVHSVS